MTDPTAHPTRADRRVPARMTAAYITQPGPASSIRIGELPTPEPGPTDVLVRAVALAVNQVDTFVRSGSYRTPMPSPFVIGRDLVGEVVEVGTGVAGFEVGDMVWSNSLGHAGRQGSFAGYSLVDAGRLYHLPGGVDPDLAVSLVHTAATAHLALFREGGLRLAETVLISGAGGGVGGAAVQLAHLAGARVIATASARDTEWCRDLGADVVIDHRDPSASERIRREAPGGVDVHIDTSGRHDLETTVGLMARGGRVIVLAGRGEHPTVPIGALYTGDRSIRGFVISNAPATDLAIAARSINALLARGRLRSRIALTLNLGDAARAHELLENPDPGRKPGRILVRP